MKDYRTIKSAKVYRLWDKFFIILDTNSLIRNASCNNAIPKGGCPAEFTVNSLVEKCTHIKEAFPKNHIVIFNS